MSFGTRKLLILEGSIDLTALPLAAQSKEITVGKEVDEIFLSRKPLRYLERYTVHSENQHYCDIDGILYSKDKLTLVSLPPNRHKSVFFLDAPKGKVGSLSLYAVGNMEKLILNVSTIESRAVSRCNALQEIKIGAAVNEIADLAFSSLPNLRSISVQEDNPVFCSYADCLYSDGGETLVHVPACLPEKIETHPNFVRVGPNAFVDRIGVTELY